MAIWRALFTYLHLLSAGLLGGLLLAQHWMLKRPVGRGDVALFGALGLGQLLAAIGALASGSALMAQFGSGAPHYLSNPLFLLKIGLFALMALASGWPLSQYVTWSRQLRSQPTFAPLGREIERLRAVLGLMLGLLALIPLPSVMLVRGFGG
jgi:putative membrane protein